MKDLSRVIIVGQPNVGKSVLFNRLTHTNQAITSHVAHTTRDQNRGVVRHKNIQFELIDSAGFAKSDDPLSKLAIAQLAGSITSSDLVIFLVDGTKEIDSNDLKLSKLILKAPCQKLLLLNKSDKKEFIDNPSYFRKLGIERMLNISAQNGQGISELLDDIVTLIPRKKAIKAAESIRVALLGKPNVGKSALLNAMAEEELALVSDIAGTTRDVNSAQIKFRGNSIALYDTAGLRRRGKIEAGIEFFSITRTKRAIEMADVCLVLIDANEGLTNQDEHIIGMVKEAQKALIVVVSKWDKLEKDENTMAQLSNQISANLQYVWWAPLIFTSAHDKQNLEKLKQLIVDIYQRLNTKLTTKDLNAVLQKAINNQPPVTTKGYHAKLNYITQTGNNPIELSLFGTHPDLIHFSYMRYIENQIRQNFKLVGVPIKLVFRSKYKEGV